LGTNFFPVLMRSAALVRINQVLLLAVLSVVVLYYGRLFLVPLAFAAILAMLLAPVARRLEGWGLGRVSSTLGCLLLLLAFVGGVVWIVGEQATTISGQLPQIQQKLQQVLGQGQQWIQQRFGVAPERQVHVVQEQIGKISQSANRYLTSSLRGLSALVGGFVLVLLYLFFLLWGRRKFRGFLLALAPAEQRGEADQMLTEMRRVAAQYLSGRLLSILFLAVIYAIGFSFIGLKNALGISLLAALPTLVPYVGAFIGASFPLTLALVGGASDQVLPVAGIIVVAQVLDNNLIEPLVMGSQLNLSPIFTIVAVVAGELLWGIPGMILFEPMLAILRIGCSHVPALRPYALLLENEVSKPRWITKLTRWLKRDRSAT
jgi:predicted PurR-regulated permease PerM